ncbi:MAG TPA: hypothetical protein VF928_00510 [Usitatibacteraceae bacterium]
MAETKPIRLALKDASILNPPAEPGPGEHFAPLAAAINAAYRERFGGAGLGANDAIALAAAVGDFLDVAAQLDAEYGADGVLPVRDAADAADEALRCATELDPWLDRFELASWRPALHAAVLGIGLWMMRHQLALATPEPIVNALAFRANEAATRQETAAAYALMQGFIAHLAPQLDADLERSNPERPWRLLNLNFAITAIRTGDAALMRFAFDTLNNHLPDERAGFYEEACALASQPGFLPETRALIEAEHARWSRVH